MRFKRPIISGVVLASAAAIVMVAPGVAAGATAVYAPNSEARNFHTTAGGWVGAVKQDGLVCIAPVTCPTVTPSFVGANGAGGAQDGHLRVRISGLTNVLTVSRGVYRSPTFKYNGVGGKQPNELKFTMARRANLAGLLNIPNAAAHQAIKLVDVTSGGSAVTVTGPQNLASNNTWAKRPAVQVNPSRLTIGDNYKITLIAAFTTPISVIPSSTVDYDNVTLTAKRGGGGGGGGNQRNRFAKQVKKGLGPARLVGKRLYVRVKCPNSAAPNKCRMKVTPLLTKSGPRVAKARKVRARAGARRHVRLKVKRMFRATLQDRKRIWVKAKVSAGDKTVKVKKRVKLKKQ